MNNSFPNLNLPQFELKIRQIDESNYEIYDRFRKKYLVLTPEEWVRQNFAIYLVEYLNYPASRIKLEHHISLADKNYRCDIVYFDKSLEPNMIVECKSAQTKLNLAVFNQISLYNTALTVKYLIVTNGLKHYAAEIDYAKKDYKFLDYIPKYK